MRRIKIIFKVLFLIILILPSISYPQKLRILTLNEAISLAKNNNSELITAKMEKLKADDKVSEVYSSNLIPNISLNSSYNRAFKKPVFVILGQNFEIGADNTISNTLEISEPIPILGTPVFSGIRIAKYYSKLQEEIISGIESKIKTDVKKAYYSVLLTKELVNVNNLSLKNSIDNLNIVEAKFRSGTVTEFDLLRAKVKVESIKPNLSQSESNLVIAQKMLKNVIGIKTEEQVDVTGKLTYDSSEVYGNTDDLIKKIAEKNVSVRQLNISKLISEELVKVSTSSFLPKFYLFSQFGLTANENDEKQFLKYRYYRTVNAGIGLSWDLNFLKNSYTRSQSLTDVKKTEELISDVKQKLKIQAQNVILKIEDAKKRIIAQNENIKLAERGYELANISYKGGVLNQIDVLDAELMLNQSRLGYYQAIYDYLSAIAELEGLLEK